MTMALNDTARKVPIEGGSNDLELRDFIDHQPIGGFQIRLLLLCAAILFIDGFDTQAIGYVAPSLGREWNLAPGALSIVFSASLIGLMIGSVLLGSLADLFGRKKMIVLSTIVFGVMTFAAMFAPDLTTLIVLRFLTGLGLGGAMPNTIALTAEFSPRRRRATMVMLMFAGFSIGAATGGLISAVLIPTFGWKSIFFVGGLAPLCLVPLLVLRLPESPRFLALKANGQKNVRTLVQRMFPDKALDIGVYCDFSDSEHSGTPVVQLFARERIWATLSFWLVFYMNLLQLFLLSNWLPTILTGLGTSFSTAAIIGSMLQIGGFVGVVVLGRLIDKFAFRALLVVYVGAILSVSMIGITAQSIPLLILAIFCAGFCIVGGQISANALVAGFYPAHMRSTGVGWALGIGRLGSIVGPIIGGLMLSNQISTQSLFLIASVPAVFAAFGSFALSCLNTGRRIASH